MMRTSAKLWALLAGAVLSTAAASCNSVNVNTPTRSLNGPSDVALICVQASPHDPSVYDVHPIADCSPDRIGILRPVRRAARRLSGA